MPSTPSLPNISSPFDGLSTAEEVAQNIDLTGKVALVTGGTKGGLGYETARVLALRGANVFITARDEKKGSEAVNELIKQTGNSKIEYLVIRLDDFNSVREGLKPFIARNLPLHILILNAGIMSPASYGTTVQGFEQQFGVNHLSHFLMTLLLIDQLKAANSSRVVVVGALAHKWCPTGIQWDNINWTKAGSYEKQKAYGQSKIANTYFSNELDRRYSEYGIRSFSLHPGVIFTNLARDVATEEIEKMKETYKDAPAGFFKSMEQGAATTIFAAVSPLLDGYGGLYLENNDIAPITDEKAHNGVSAWMYDSDQERRLWEESLKWTGLA